MTFRKINSTHLPIRQNHSNCILETDVYFKILRLAAFNKIDGYFKRNVALVLEPILTPFTNNFHSVGLH